MRIRHEMADLKERAATALPKVLRAFIGMVILGSILLNIVVLIPSAYYSIKLHAYMPTIVLIILSLLFWVVLLGGLKLLVHHHEQKRNED